MQWMLYYMYIFIRIICTEYFSWNLPIIHYSSSLIFLFLKYKVNLISNFIMYFCRITSVDISPEWPEKKCVLTGSFDGAVKQWTIEQESTILKIKQTHSHEVHCHEMEVQFTKIPMFLNRSEKVLAPNFNCYQNLTFIHRNLFWYVRLLLVQLH